MLSKSCFYPIITHYLSQKACNEPRRIPLFSTVSLQSLKIVEWKTAENGANPSIPILIHYYTKQLEDQARN